MPTCPAALTRFSPEPARNWEQRLTSRPLLGLRLLMFLQAVLPLALSWLCVSVQWCVGFRVIGPY